ATDPRQVVLAERGSCDDPEAVLGEARNGEVALDPAALIEHLRVGDGADIARDPVVAQVLQARRRAGADELDLRERGLVEQRRGLAAGAVLGADGGRPDLARPAARP